MISTYYIEKPDYSISSLLSQSRPNQLEAGSYRKERIKHLSMYNPEKSSPISSESMVQLFQQLMTLLKMFLENSIAVIDKVAQGENMATKINRKFTLNHETCWVHANSETEYVEKLIALLGSKGLKQAPEKPKHNFREYALNWFEVYSKPNIGTSTATTYKRQLDLYLVPALGHKAVEDITTDDLQRMFNGMSGAKATKEKARIVLNMVFDTALEDGIISKNPMKSKRLKITGSASKETPPYTVEQMQFLVERLEKVQEPGDRAFLALQALHPLRLEEVLGLKWEDIDLESMVLHIRRAVTHPNRNQPEIKDTKTEASARDIGLSQIAVKYLTPGKADEFVLGGEKPLSYTQVRRICNRIQRDTGFSERITPRRFRTTVLTDIYDQTHDIKQAQAAAGHTTSAMTLKHYVKGRGTASEAAAAIDRLYGSTAG